MLYFLRPLNIDNQASTMPVQLCRECATVSIHVDGVLHGSPVSCETCATEYIFCAACYKHGTIRSVHLQRAFNINHKDATHLRLGANRTQARDAKSGTFKTARSSRSNSSSAAKKLLADWTWGRLSAVAPRSGLISGSPMALYFDAARAHRDFYDGLIQKVAMLNLANMMPESERKEWSQLGPIQPADAVGLLDVKMEALNGHLRVMGLRLSQSLTSENSVYISNHDEGYLGLVHSDGLDQVMLVLTGCKTVWIAPPPPVDLAGSGSSGKSIAFTSHGFEYKETSQESRIKRKSTFINYAVDRGVLATDPWRRVTLGAGAAFYLPMGWLHCVDSAPRTISLSLAAEALT